jgi:hypothetical protein
VSDVDISIDVGERLDLDLAGLTAKGLARFREIAQELVRLWREDLLEVWPVDTGRSQASWSNRFAGTVWVLRNPVEYASFVHNSGDPTEVWTFLEARAEELLGEVEDELVALFRRESAVEKSGRRSRVLIGFAARLAVARQVEQRVFLAQAERFRAVDSRTRTQRQARRLAA